MTSPALAFPVTRRGRHYPFRPDAALDWLAALPRNKNGDLRTVKPDAIPDGIDPYPSVTNCISVYDSGGGGLLGWAAEEGITERLTCSLCATGHPDVHCKGNRCGCDAVPDDELHLYHSLGYHKWACNRARNAAADRGTRAHTIAERLSLDVKLPASISAEDEAYADAYLSFVTDHDPEWVHVEATVFNSQHRYAGTGDWIARTRGRIALGDYKTKPTIDKANAYDQHWLQLAALMYHTDLWTGDELIAPVRADVGMVVFLTPEGYVVEEKTADELVRYFAWFCDLRRVWSHKNEEAAAA